MASKILVVFYSRTGNTKKVAMKIAKILKADIDEIKDRKDRKGIKGWFIAGGDAYKNNLTEINALKTPSKYSLVIVGTPIWAFTLTPPVRTYLLQNKFKKLAFFSTSGGSGIKKTFAEMEKSSKKPVAVLAIKVKGFSSKIDLDANKESIEDFCRKLKH